MLLKKQFLLLNVSYEYFCENQVKKKTGFFNELKIWTEIWRERQRRVVSISNRSFEWLSETNLQLHLLWRNVSLQQGDMFLDKMKRSSKIHLYLKRALLHTVRVGDLWHNGVVQHSCRWCAKTLSSSGVHQLLFDP